MSRRTGREDEARTGLDADPTDRPGAFVGDSGAAGPAPRRDRPPATGSVESFRFPVFHRATLGNGATLLAARVERGPLVQMSLLFPGGAEHETAEQACIATLLGGMHDEGTAELSALELAILV